MNSQNEKEGLGYSKAIRFVGMFALIAVYAIGFILVWNLLVGNGVISIGSKKQTLPQSTTSRFTDGSLSYAASISYEPPSGWKIIEYPGLKYKIATGPRTNDFAPNFNIIEETFIGTLDDYASANLESLRHMFTDFEVISQEKSETNAGDTYIKIVAEDTQDEKRLRQTAYFFAYGDTKFVITYTRLSNMGEENDTLVDQSMKTFRVEK
jgi:hypothetical protein